MDIVPDESFTFDGFARAAAIAATERAGDDAASITTAAGPVLLGTRAR